MTNYSTVKTRLFSLFPSTLLFPLGAWWYWLSLGVFLHPDLTGVLCHLSNALGLSDQLVVSEEDYAREGGCLGEKYVKSLARFSLLFIRVCERI